MSAGLKRMYRYEIPVDDREYEVMLTSDPKAVAASSDSRYVEFWAEYDDNAPRTPRVVQVYGTGQPIPNDAVWRGTTPRINGLVWHLYEVPR